MVLECNANVVHAGIALTNAVLQIVRRLPNGGRRFLFFCPGIMDIFFRGFAVLATVATLIAKVSLAPMATVTWHQKAATVSMIE
jgi:hypothetical protein